MEKNSPSLGNLKHGGKSHPTIRLTENVTLGEKCVLVHVIYNFTQKQDSSEILR